VQHGPAPTLTEEFELTTVPLSRRFAELVSLIDNVTDVLMPDQGP
jgi:hypothetical protein